MVDVSLLPHAEFGPNDHREYAPFFRILPDEYKYIKQNEFLAWKHDSNDRYQLLFLL